MTEQHTLGPWILIQHRADSYPFPLSIHTADGSSWIARDGQVSSKANARLIAAAPETAAERDRLRAVNVELVEALTPFAKVLDGYVNNAEDSEVILSAHTETGKVQITLGDCRKARAAHAKTKEQRT